jgi:hypothetical protein
MCGEVCLSIYTILAFNIHRLLSSFCSIYIYVTEQWRIIQARPAVPRPHKKISLSLVTQYHSHARVADLMFLKPLNSPG